MISAAA